jgi:signal transduction histidine kinase
MAQLNRQLGMAITLNRWLATLMAAGTLAPGVIRSQSALHWSTYKLADGLCEPGFDSLFISPKGELIATHRQATQAAALDGYGINNISVPAGCWGPISESPGGQRWALVPQGLAEFRKQKWVRHFVPELNAAFRPDSPPPEFLPVRQGAVLFLLTNGLMEFLSGKSENQSLALLPAETLRIGSFTGMAEARDESLWVSGTRGLARATGPVRNLKPGAACQEYLPPESLQLRNFSQPIPGDDAAVTLVAESSASRERVVVTFDGPDWTVLPAGPRNFFRAWREPDLTVWATTTNALFQWSAVRSNWVEHAEIAPGRISDVAVEPGGAFWLATSDGLFRGSPATWSQPPAVGDLDAAVNCLVLDRDGWLSFVAGGSLHRVRGGSHHAQSCPMALPDSRDAHGLVALRDGSLLLQGTNGWYQFRPADGSFARLPGQDQAPLKPLGRLADGCVCCRHDGAAPQLDCYDGIRFRPWPDPPPLRQEDEPLTTLFTSRNGDLWLGGERGVFWCHAGTWERFVSPDHTMPEAVVDFGETKGGMIWCATEDELWQFDGRNWSRSASRFNHINRLVQDHGGGLWLASNGGLFRYFEGIWMENGREEGLPADAVTALCEDAEGRMWAGGLHGLSVFHPAANANPPRTSVRWLGGSNRRLTEGEALNLWFDGCDKWKITPRDRLLYSYRLDQQAWSAFQDLAMITLAGPGPGRHSVQVRAMDRNGNVDPSPATLDFLVVTPWFRETRLWIVLLLGAAAAVFFAAVAWNRHRQLIRSYAAVELKVAERTRELEIATRELLHSQKMNALGTLAAGIAHDFNNILSIIKGSAQIIEDHTDDPEKIRTRVDRIKTVVQQGAEIVEAMLGFGRDSESGAKPCDLNVVVADTIKLLGDRFLHQVDVRFEPAPALPPLSTSREFIQQILLNFIFNAAEAMPRRKTVTLSTRAAEKLPPDIFLPPAAAAAFVLVSVQDEGGGMTPEIKARIFEPFFTTKALSTRRGTGLGLSMVYELAKKLGAGLAVQSAVGQGSTFTLILPVQPAPAAKASLPT